MKPRESVCVIGNCLSDSVNREEKGIADIRSSRQIETHILAFIQEKLTQYNKGKTVETRILKFIVYAEI